MRNKTSNIRRLFLASMISLTLASLGLWSAVWIHGEYSAFKVESESLRGKFLEEQQDLLRNQVAGVVDYVRYMMDQTRARLKTSIQERTEEAWRVAMNIYLENRNSKTPAEIKTMIREALRPIRFNNGRGYYFAFNLDGVAELRPDNRELEGTSVLDITGANGEYVVRDMRNLAMAQGEGSYEYTWKKLDGSGRYAPKLAFVKLFQPYGWVMGTGEYLDDFRDQIQAEVLNRLVNLRFGAEGYFFGSTFHGDPLFSDGQITRGGIGLERLRDPDGVMIFQDQRAAAIKPGGGFIRYSWPKLGSMTPEPKMAYVMGIPEWEWLIGAGVYLETFQSEIAGRREALKRNLVTKIQRSVLILLPLLVLIVFWARRLSNRMQSVIDAFSSFFEKAADQSVAIAPDSLQFEEFKTMARIANKMVSDRNQAEAEKERLEAQLRQAQKMEAIGALAGGIAHDFNNILAGIMGYTEMTLMDLPGHDPARRNLEEILKAASRASDLVRQILVFSRMKIAQAPQKVNVGQVVQETLRFLRASMPATIEIRQEIEEQALLTFGDPTQIHEVLINLCTNAAHAMEEKGGVLKVSLEAEELASIVSPLYPDAGPGAYLKLTVADTGHGMDAQVLEHIFEPYFTTKELGKGTGFGLAVVHGIVKSHGGAVTVRSEPGKGTTFHVYLPSIQDPEREGDHADSPVPHGTERILFVDDEELLAGLIKEMLDQLGYDVVTNTSSEEALRTFRAAPHDFDLIISDYTMPRMTGVDLAREAMLIRSDIPFILCTGFNENVNEANLKGTGVDEFLLKPFSISVIAKAIRRVIDARKT